MFDRPPGKARARLAAGNPARTICLSFLLIIGVGTLLLTMPFCSRSGQFTPALDALFTATSATCVTGLAVRDTWGWRSGAGQLVILLLIQVGGLGLVTMAAFFHLLVGRRLGLQTAELARESVSSDSFAGSRHMLRTLIWVAVLVMTVRCVLRGEEDTVIRKRKVEKQAVYRALTLISMGTLIIAASAFVIHLSFGGAFSAIDVLLEETSARILIG